MVADVSGKRITAKQAHFCRCVADGMTYAQAFRESYETKPTTKAASVHEMASRLMRRVEIRARVEQLIKAKEAAIAQRAVSDREKVVGKLRLWVDRAEDPTTGQLKSAELLGRSVGLFRDVIDTGTGGRSSDELEAQLMDRLRAMGLIGEGDDPDVIDAEFTEVPPDDRSPAGESPNNIVRLHEDQVATSEDDEQHW